MEIQYRQKQTACYDYLHCATQPKLSQEAPVVFRKSSPGSLKDIESSSLNVG